MLPYLSHNPEWDRADREQRSAEQAWISAETWAPALAERQVQQHGGDTLAAVWAFVVDRAWRSKPDDFESLVAAATRIELESRLTQAEAAVWQAWQAWEQQDAAEVALADAVRARHARHRLSPSDVVRMAA